MVPATVSKLGKTDTDQEIKGAYYCNPRASILQDYWGDIKEDCGSGG